MNISEDGSNKVRNTKRMEPHPQNESAGDLEFRLLLVMHHCRNSFFPSKPQYLLWAGGQFLAQLIELFGYDSHHDV